MSEYIDTLNINDVDYDIKDSGALHQSDVAAVATSGSYSDLTNKPKINNVELSGNKTAAQLGLQTELTIDATPTEDSTNPVQSGGVYEALDTLVPRASLFGGFITDAATPNPDDSRIYFLTLLDGDLPNFEIYNLPDNGKWKIVRWNPRDAGWDYETIDCYTSSQIDQLLSAVAAAISGKQDAISDLAAIRSGAAAGATALQSSDITPIENAISIIESVIPAQVSVQNQLADKNFVNSQVTTASANFVGTFETLAELQAVQNPTKNDYGFVIETDALGNQYYDRYKYNGTVWLFEYKVESTSFTSEQWAAIQSGITSALVQKINDVIPSNASSSNKLATASDVNSKLNAPATAGTSGQVLTSDGQGGQSWQTPQSGGVTDVTVGGTSVVSGGVAAVPAIPTVPIISTDIESDSTSDTKTTSPKAVKTFVENQGYGTYSKPSGGIPASDLANGVIPNSVVNATSQQDGTVVFILANGDIITVDLNHTHPNYYKKTVETTQPQGGFLPDVEYALGPISGNVTFQLASIVVGNVNHYFWSFSTSTSIPTITWPSRIIWQGGTAPTISANKYYEISILNSMAVYLEMELEASV